jgi:RNA polymerase sigma-70 factor (ECF subfamily)
MHREFAALVTPRVMQVAKRLAFRILKNEVEAEDAVQDALLKAYRFFRGYRASSKFLTWFGKIVMNAARDIIRRSSKISRTAPDDLMDDQQFANFSQEDGLQDQRDELLLKIRCVVAQMSETAQRVFELRFEKGLSYRDIAKRLGIPLGTVSKTLFSIRKRVQETLH